MGFKWPKLTHTLENVAGYKGVRVEVVLNPDPLPEREYSGKGHDTWTYHRWAQIIERIVIPGEYRDDGQEYVVDVDGDPKVVWELEQSDDFDTRILLLTMSDWGRARMTEAGEAEKN